MISPQSWSWIATAVFVGALVVALMGDIKWSTFGYIFAGLVLFTIVNGFILGRGIDKALDDKHKNGGA